jgi:formate dehydrogenase alpha subunit
MINLKIDGQDVQIARGATILDAAESVGITIPTLCYLKKISPTGACRVCAVEIKGADKTMTACNTRAVDGMEVTTQSEKLSLIRRQIVELLLVNHPLDCPVCDAGGECDLQDICYAQDVTSQPFEADDVNAATIDKWPLIQQVPNRCIMCEKCVKVCHEVIGADSLFINEKGDRAFIDKALEKCVFCGNCVQVCPTGTMISKPFKFKARPWELRKTASVCTLCPAHCQVDLHSKQGQVLRLTSEDGKTVNDGNLCVGGFFAHDYLASTKRLSGPLARQNDRQQAVTWEEALGLVATELKSIRETSGGQAIAGLASPRLTNEENYLFQKLFRVALRSNNIDSEARFGALRAAKVMNKQLRLTGASQHFDRIGRTEAILVFGSDPGSEAPAVGWQIQNAALKHDAKLIVANMRKGKLAEECETFLQYLPGSEVSLASALTRLIVDKGLADQDFLQQFVGNLDELTTYLAGINLEAACAAAGIERELLEEAADYIGQANSVAIVFGRDLTTSARAEEGVAALANLALVSGALHSDRGGLFPIDEKGNMQGLLDAGVCPEMLPGFQDYAVAKDKFAAAWHTELPEGGADATGILAGIENGSIRALYLAGTNPLIDFPESLRWRKALEKVDFLVVQDILSGTLTELADVVLAGAASAEKRGSMTALDHRVNNLRIAVDPPGEARPDLAILADLFARISGKPAPSDAAVRREMVDLSGVYSDVCQTLEQRNFCWKEVHAPVSKSLSAATPELTSVPAAELQLLIGKSRFQFGSTTTASAATTELEAGGVIEINPADAAEIGVADGGRIKLTGPAGSATGPVKLSDQLPAGLLFAAYNFADLNIQQLATSGGNCVQVTAAKA